MANNEDIVRYMRELEAGIEQAVTRMPDDGWSRGVHENGWNARQLLSHIASMSGTVGFVLGMARMPSPPSLGAGFDEDAFNARLVAEREGKSTFELLGEIKGNFERDIEALLAAPEDLMREQFRAPWGVEDTVAGVIMASLGHHLAMHSADLRSAAE
jgi:Mycothiol maleylpyruvate isomerase N-terminal domain